MNLTQIAQGSALLLASMSALADSQPVCRWLELDDTRIYQCALLPEVVAQSKSALVDGLPDPTRPLAEQKISLEVNSNIAVITPSKERFSREFKAATRPEKPEVAARGRYMVLGVGDVAMVKARLRERNDTHFSVLPSRQRISLGVFSTEANARKRIDGLLDIGISAEIEPMTTRANRISEVQEAIVSFEPKPEQGRGGVLVKTTSEPKLTKKIAPKRPEESYLVATLGDAKRVLAALRSLDDNDFVMLRSGPYGGRVSVGVYTSLANATARQEFFASEGIETEIVARLEDRVIRRGLELPQIAAVPRDI